MADGFAFEECQWGDCLERSLDHAVAARLPGMLRRMQLMRLSHGTTRWCKAVAFRDRPYFLRGMHAALDHGHGFKEIDQGKDLN